MNNEMKIGSLSSQTRYSCLGKDLEVVPTKKKQITKNIYVAEPENCDNRGNIGKINKINQENDKKNLTGI